MTSLKQLKSQTKCLLSWKEQEPPPASVLQALEGAASSERARTNPEHSSFQQRAAELAVAVSWKRLWTLRVSLLSTRTCLGLRKGQGQRRVASHALDMDLVTSAINFPPKTHTGFQIKCQQLRGTGRGLHLSWQFRPEQQKQGPWGKKKLKQIPNSHFFGDLTNICSVPTACWDTTVLMKGLDLVPVSVRTCGP